MIRFMIFLILLSQSLEVLGSFKELYPDDCGWTPLYAKEQIIGGNISAPDELSWLASLVYGKNNTILGSCGGSVINSWYVLTAAHCVKGDNVVRLGGLNGVRLGDFGEHPYCDYGTSDCSFYQHFGITKKIVHENYHKDRKSSVLNNDIALLRVSRKIQFDNVLKPICLPSVTVSEPEGNTILIVAGWSKDYVGVSAKRYVGVPLVSDSKICDFQDDSRFCAGVPSAYYQRAKSACSGDSGGPLMYQFKERHMMIEGIVSFIVGGQCVNHYYATHYTRVRHYLKWINENMVTVNSSPTTTTTISPTTSASARERKFPTDCLDNDYVRNNETSRLARMVHSKDEPRFNCGGTVINSLYVLTVNKCINTNTLTRVRLVDFNKCDDGTKDCKHYKEFSVKKLLSPLNCSSDSTIVLLRLWWPIQLGPKMKPTCLPLEMSPNSRSWLEETMKM